MEVLVVSWEEIKNDLFIQTPKISSVTITQRILWILYTQDCLNINLCSSRLQQRAKAFGDETAAGHAILEKANDHQYILSISSVHFFCLTLIFKNYLFAAAHSSSNTYRRHIVLSSSSCLHFCYVQSLATSRLQQSWRERGRGVQKMWASEEMPPLKIKCKKVYSLSFTV